MKLGIALLVLAGAIIITATVIEGQNSGQHQANSNGNVRITAPHLKHERTIDLKHKVWASCLRKLAFSPDGRYLAIIDNPTMGVSTLIIWDMQNNREQSRTTDLEPFGDWPNVNILWDPEGKYVTIGFGNPAAGIPMRLWDPMTGKVLKEEGVRASYAKLNKDGTKLLASMGITQNTFRIYDTKTWYFKEFVWDGDIIETISWTVDDKVIVVGDSKVRERSSSDGLIIRTSDTIARLIDPSGKQDPRTVVLSPGNREIKVKNVVAIMPSEHFDSSVVDYAGNKVAFGSGHIKVLDGSTLQLLYTYAPSEEDLQKGRMPDGFPDTAFSPDGKYLYVVGSSLDCNVKSLILDAATGSILGSFEGGGNGFSISRDGKQMALGKWDTVELFSIR